MEEPIVPPPTPSRDEVTKYWLLNLAVEFGIGLNRIFPLVNTLSLNVHAVPHCAAEDYARNVLDLFNSGMIVFSSENPEDELNTGSGISGVLDRFLRLPEDYQRVRYVRPGDRSSLEIDRNPALQVNFRLTARGGEAWETLAAPEWSRFISGSTTPPAYGETGPSQGELISPDRDLLLAWMGWYPEVNGEGILADTINLEEHIDFDVLYWKRLPHVYHATFEVESAQERWTQYEVPKWFFKWQTDRRHWHKDPWQLPSWPAD